MKKITLLFAIFVVIAASFASTKRWFWYGDTPQIATSQYLDMGTTANWYDPTTIDPLIPFIVPDNFTTGSTAILDETAVTGSDTLKLNGGLNVDSLLVNNTRTYVLRSKTGYTADSITGTGVFVKDGSGVMVMDCKNLISGGTVIKNGTLMMEKVTSPNIFGTKLVFQGGTANFGTTSSGSTYATIKTPIEIPAGVTAKIYCSRYSYMASPITGSGDLNIQTGGERCMFGTNKNEGYPVDWSKFTGNIIIGRHTLSSKTSGFYSFLLPAKSTQFDPSNMTNIDSMFIGRKVTLNSAGFSTCSGTHCWAIGELQANNDSAFLSGYGAAASTTPKAYYMFGFLNTDVVFPGTIYDNGGKGYNWVGLIKVGTGKYTFTSTKSLTTASMGVIVKQGTFLINIPVTTPATTTALGRVKNTVMSIKAGAIGGGNGRLTGSVLVDSLGTLIVGYDGIGQLDLADTLKGTIASPLNVSHYGTVIMKVSSKTNSDLITSNSTVTFNGGTLLVKGTNASINAGDTITLISYKKAASSKDTINFKSEGLPSELSYSLKTDTVKTITTTILKSVITGLDSIKTTTTYQYKIDLIAKSISALRNTSDNTVSVYPSPSTGLVNIDSKDADINSVEVLNIQGQVVMKTIVGSKNTRLYLEKLPAGIYYTKIYIGNEVKTRKIMLR